MIKLYRIVEYLLVLLLLLFFIQERKIYEISKKNIAF